MELSAGRPQHVLCAAVQLLCNTTAQHKQVRKVRSVYGQMWGPMLRRQHAKLGAVRMEGTCGAAKALDTPHSHPANHVRFPMLPAPCFSPPVAPRPVPPRPLPTCPLPFLPSTNTTFSSGQATLKTTPIDCGCRTTTHPSAPTSPLLTVYVYVLWPPAPLAALAPRPPHSRPPPSAVSPAPSLPCFPLPCLLSYPPPHAPVTPSPHRLVRHAAGVGHVHPPGVDGHNNSLGWGQG